MLKKIKRLCGALRAHGYRLLFGRFYYSRFSFSQEGEDLVLFRLFEGIRSGVYVDVGAHHPFRFSNTYGFYRRGWCGVNIDAMPGSMGGFLKHRSRDVNVEMGVASNYSVMEYFSFQEPALNTFDKKLALERQASGCALKDTIRVECRPLGEILDRSLPLIGATCIDFMSVDVEGFDLQVLKSNEWGRFRPKAIVVEALGFDLEGVLSSDVAQYLHERDYVLFSKLHHSVVFVCKKWHLSNN